MASYFLPSSIGSRILRFALSRLDYLDDKAIDLDQLNFSLGSRSVFSFRDVGLRTQKISELLPPQIVVTKAQIGLLRVTVPADIYRSGITVEVIGVKVQGKISEHEAPTSKGRRRSDGTSPDIPIPTTEDLAKSFLQEEPVEEKKELEAAINSQSQHLHTSGLDGSEPELGMGVGVTLPGIFTTFLNGIRDRLEVSIEGIDLEVETEVPSEDSEDEEPTPVALVFHIGRADIEGVTSGKIDPEAHASTQGVSRDGKRRIMLSNLTSGLLLDERSMVKSRVSSLRSSPAKSASVRSEAMSCSSRNSALAASELSDLRSGLASTHRSRPSTGPPSPVVARTAPDLAESVLTTDDDRFADPLDNTNESGHDPVSPDGSGDYGQQSVYGEQSFLQYAVDNGMFDSTLDEGSPAHSRAEMAAQHDSHHHVSFSSNSLPVPESQQIPDQSEYNSPSLHSQPVLGHTSTARASPPQHDFTSPGMEIQEPIEAAGARDTSSHPSPTSSHGDSSDRSFDPQSPASPADNDLSQSRFFSHEEAESMYMSAMDDTPAARSTPFHIPGGWDTHSETSDEPAREPSVSSPLAPIAEKDDGIKTPRPHSRADEASDSQSPPGRVLKSLVDIQNVSLWLPSEFDLDDAITPAAIPSSTAPAVGASRPPRVSFADPAESSRLEDTSGSFLHYAERTGRSSVYRHMEPESGSQPQPQSARSALPTPDDSIEIAVGAVQVRVDVDMVYLMVRLFQGLVSLFGNQPTGDPPKSSNEISSSVKPVLGKCAVESVSIALLKELLNRDPQDSSGFAAPDPSDILLKMQLGRLSADSFKEDGVPKMTLSLAYFIFGFADQPILTFDTNAGLDETTVDVTGPQTSAVSIDYNFSRSEVNVGTLPLKVFLDVQKLDDTFTSYGGFSGVLRISNHLASTCPLPPPSAKGSRASPSSVLKTQASGSQQNSMPKINIRLGGTTLKLKGESCVVLLQTSSVRAVLRERMNGVRIRHASFSGPYGVEDDIESVTPALYAELNNTHVEFATAPHESDLSNLLSLITPTQFPYESDDDILIDTLLAQRQKGSVLRVYVKGDTVLNVSNIEQLQSFQCLSNDIAKLSTVAKLLPDDERPGILSIIKATQVQIDVTVNERIGSVFMKAGNVRAAHVGLPALIALEVGSLEARRGESELLVDKVHETEAPEDAIPAIMARLLGDEMEPTLKVKLFNTLVDYRVSTIMAALGLPDYSSADDIALGIAKSVATIKRAPSPGNISRRSSTISDKSRKQSKPLGLDVLFRDCAIGLNPLNLPAKALFVLTKTRFTGTLVDEAVMTAALDIKKASLLLVDDTNRLLVRAPDEPENAKAAGLGSHQVAKLCRLGFVSVGTTSNARATVKIMEPENPIEGSRCVDVEFANDLFVMESCADSTQTLIAIFGDLAPPQPPSEAVQFRTNIEPMTDMMASLAGLGEGNPGSPDSFDSTKPKSRKAPVDNLNLGGVGQSIIVENDGPDGLGFAGSLYDPDYLPELDSMTEESILEESMRYSQGSSSKPKALRLSSPTPNISEELDFDQDFFGASSTDKPTAQGWSSRKNEYVESSELTTQRPPLMVRVRDVHFIWNLYDGYDWPHVREKLGEKLEEVQMRAQARRERRFRDDDDDDDGATIEEDLLFGSVYVAIPLNKSPEENRRAINDAIKGHRTSSHDEDTTSVTSYATGTSTTSRGTAKPKSWARKLKLERGRHHKITFELSGVEADVTVFPSQAESEAQNSLDVRVRDLDVVDHVPSSTWKKFVTYDKDSGDREMNKPMIRLECMSVRPVSDLAASELIIRVSVLPLRLHVDQDALDFITRFFEFKDDRHPAKESSSTEPFIQRLEVRTVNLQLDYKPKKVDYVGLRSGRTTEYMNFVILEGAHITLRHVIVYGVPGFDRVHKTLNDLWMPDVQKNQIPSILAGIAMFRGIASVGQGVKNLVTVPVKEYKKDGRIVRSAKKGAIAFAKTTTTELLKLGGKVSFGTQTFLQGAEGLFSPPNLPPSRSSHDASNWEDLDPSGPRSPSPAPEPKAISAYADQPIGLRAGLVSARRHLLHDFQSARDAIIAIPGEIMEKGTAAGAAGAVLKRAPVVVLRPVTGVVGAGGRVMFGVANALEGAERAERRVGDKYKSHR